MVVELLLVVEGSRHLGTLGYARVGTLHVESGLGWRLEWLILLHGMVNFSFAILAHQQTDPRHQNAIDQVEAAFQRS